MAIVPGSCTKYIQAGDVYINKPFKERMTEKYDEWLTTGKRDEFIGGGNIKSVMQRTVIQWIVEVWKEVKGKMAPDSFGQ